MLFLIFGLRTGSSAQSVIDRILDTPLSDALNEQKFPDEFLFGTATAAFQIEGAWDIDGK